MRTVVFCHAHPDDEALLTAGTMAKAAAAGHRVVLIMATDGAAGLAHSGIDDLATRRSVELHRSAALLGVHRTVHLGFADSGLGGERAQGFVHAPLEQVADAIGAVLDEETADIVVGYDANGGYGHPDHRQVHRGVRAACSHRPVSLFEATLPREPIARAAHLAAATHLTPADFDPREFDTAWTPRAHITHRVNVRAHVPAKRAAQAAHASQASADSGLRTLQVLSKIPAPFARVLLGTEFYVEVSKRAMR
ncbi:MAG TPA: PIG-L family deacetylase [Candidatus Nanopelagicales bacterium]|nr:PIG-L family deacetylase [Candidatus Nanopelagicales bacterium]